MSPLNAKTKAGLKLLATLVLCAAIFAAWTASMYLPRASAGGRVSSGVLIAALLWSNVMSLKRRRDVTARRARGLVPEHTWPEEISMWSRGRD